jgi:hypothetical protein
MPFEEALQIGKKANLRCVIFTRPEDGWCLLCPTSCELEPSERAKLVARLNGLFGSTLTVESFDLSRPWPYGRFEGEDFRIEFVNMDGHFINEMTELPTQFLLSFWNGCAPVVHGY